MSKMTKRNIKSYILKRIYKYRKMGKVSTSQVIWSFSHQEGNLNGALAPMAAGTVQGAPRRGAVSAGDGIIRGIAAFSCLHEKAVLGIRLTVRNWERLNFG